MSEKSFVTVYGSAVEGCFVTWKLNTSSEVITAEFDCPFYSTTIQTQATESWPDLIVQDVNAMDAFIIAFSIENNEVGAS